MKKTVVINVVGLTSGLIGKSTPFLSKWAAEAQKRFVEPIIPAVTCSAQATYLTGKMPEAHGIVGNGWYFKDECEVKFWKQSNKLIQAPKVWEVAREKNPTFTCSNMFWWYNMYSSVDYSVTPRPMYPSDGRKLPDVYTHPKELRDQLQEKLGTFPLFDFWGPKTSIKSSNWIAKASIEVDKQNDPTLTLIYLPHLDYNLQRLGPNDPAIEKDLREIDKVCEELIKYYEGKNAEIIVLSEYGISHVDNPVHINRALRKRGFIQTRDELGLELLDPGASKAFAVADHQVAHIYVNDKEKINEVKDLVKSLPGVELVLDEEGKKQYGLNHDRAGDLIAVANKNAWFTYYYWLDDAKAPDFARTVDIHRKPGYDPVEMFTDPNIKYLIPKVALKVLKKKLGFRMLMNVIPLDATLVKGSHGRIQENKNEWPIFISKKESNNNDLKATEVFNKILEHLFND